MSPRYFLVYIYAAMSNKRYQRDSESFDGLAPSTPEPNKILSRDQIQIWLRGHFMLEAQ